METVFGGDIGGPQGGKNKRPQKRRDPEDIIQKPRSISAKKANLVVDNVFCTHNMIKAGVIGIKTQNAEQKQQSPEQEEKPKEFAKKFMSISSSTARELT